MRILSIDGGGIRGILPGQILATLERKLQERTDNTKRIADFFDLLAGTSTGGILTCLYLCPTSKINRRPKFSASEAVDLYLNYGDEIFDVSLWRRLSSGIGLLDEKYSEKELEDTLKAYLGDLKLSELIKPCLITAYDIRRRKAHFFRKHEAEGNRKHEAEGNRKHEAEGNRNNSKNFLVRDVARATSAAPTYFEVPRIKSMSLTAHPLIDGGVFANNPAMCAYAEARTLEGEPTAKDMFILSLGTGKVKKPYYHKDAKGWGKLGWLRPVLDIMMTGVAETVHYQLKQIFASVGKKDHYVRIEPELAGASPDMDNAKVENLQALKEAGDQWAEEHDKILNDVADCLVGSKATNAAAKAGGRLDGTSPLAR